MPTYVDLILLEGVKEVRDFKARYHTRALDLNLMYELIEMVRSDENIATILTHVMTNVFCGDLEIVTGAYKMPEAEALKVSMAWVPFAKRAFDYFVAWGFCLVGVDAESNIPVNVEPSDDVHEFGIAWDRQTRKRVYYSVIGLMPEIRHVLSSGPDGMGIRAPHPMSGCCVVETEPPFPDGRLGSKVQCLMRTHRLVTAWVMLATASAYNNVYPGVVTESRGSAHSRSVYDEPDMYRVGDRRAVEDKKIENDTDRLLYGPDTRTDVRALYDNLMGRDTNGGANLSTDGVTGSIPLGSAQFSEMAGRPIPIPSDRVFKAFAPLSQPPPHMMELRRAHAERCGAVLGVPQTVTGVADGRTSTEYAVMNSYMISMAYYSSVMHRFLTIVAWIVYGDMVHTATVGEIDRFEAERASRNEEGAPSWFDALDPSAFSIEVHLSRLIPPHTALQMYSHGLMTHNDLVRTMAKIYRAPVDVFSDEHIDPASGLPVSEVREADIQDQIRLMWENAKVQEYLAGATSGTGGGENSPEKSGNADPERQPSSKRPKTSLAPAIRVDQIGGSVARALRRPPPGRISKLGSDNMKNVLAPDSDSTTRGPPL